MHVSWDDAHALAEHLAKRIRASGYEPDVLVAVSRGGFDPARMLCDLLGVRRLGSVQVEAYSAVGVRGEPKVVTPLNTDVSGLRVLLVDDVSDTGGSLRVAKAHIVSKGAREVRVAALHLKPWTSLTPDYWAGRTEDWIVYPWERRESILDLAAKLREEGCADIRVELRRLGFSERDIRSHLE
jgi:hypoxanthine phosphoribosyltransferase